MKGIKYTPDAVVIRKRAGQQIEILYPVNVVCPQLKVEELYPNQPINMVQGLVTRRNPEFSLVLKLNGQGDGYVCDRGHNEYKKMQGMIEAVRQFETRIGRNYRLEDGRIYMYLREDAVMQGRNPIVNGEAVRVQRDADYIEVGITCIFPFP